MNFDISIIIVNYNTKNYLLNCVNSIFESMYRGSFEVIVVDNNSCDNSIKLIEDNNKVDIIKNNDNLGFSKAVNMGLKKSLGKYVCILNPDTVLDINSLEILFDYMEEEIDVACVSPKIINSDGTFQISCKRSLPKIKNSFFKLTAIDRLFPDSIFFSSYNLLYLDENISHQVEVISGACMFIRRKTFESVGYFDESFFLYGEDIDYCHRMSDLKMKVVYYPSSKVTHFKGVSAQSRPYEVISEFHNSMIKYYNKYESKYPIWRFFKIFIVSIIIMKKYLSYFIHLLRNRIK